ncbi:MAG TPA: acetyl-CoA carboxylase biotin carboxyl carrier protein [Gemmataceae bacterium]|nr:acetyl-CoA carboxylase biotin carboxyl carrier protein [Gemmataceae bacterium]
MADAKQPTPGPFDVMTVRELVELMDKFDLSEVDLNHGDQRIRLRRGKPVIAAPQQPLAYQPAPTYTPPPQFADKPAVTEPPAAGGKKLLEIKSELVGTFYAKPSPEKDDYVKVGSKVTPDSVVCKVEAMKIFNDITAKVSGTVAEVCVKNGDFVEFEQVLFRVDPS